MDATPPDGSQASGADVEASSTIDVEAAVIAEEEATGDPDIAVVEIKALPERRAKAASRGALQRRKPSGRGANGAAGAKMQSGAQRRAPRKPRARTSRPAPDTATGADIDPELYLTRLVARSDIGKTGVVSVDTPLGRLAVGIARGKPFAVSDTCRHLFASLGEGRVARDGCLQCPWHRSRYDVSTGQMTRGPQGMMWLTVREIVRTYTNLLFPLRVFPVVERDSVLYLDTAAAED